MPGALNTIFKLLFIDTAQFALFELLVLLFLSNGTFALSCLLIAFAYKLRIINQRRDFN